MTHPLVIIQFKVVTIVFLPRVQGQTLYLILLFMRLGLRFSRCTPRVEAGGGVRSMALVVQYQP